MSDESLPWMGPSLGAAVRHIGLEHNSPPSSATAVVWRFGKPISGRMRSCGSTRCAAADTGEWLDLSAHARGGEMTDRKERNRLIARIEDGPEVALVTRRCRQHLCPQHAQPLDDLVNGRGVEIDMHLTRCRHPTQPQQRHA
jgi:hypothetical protein